MDFLRAGTEARKKLDSLEARIESLNKEISAVNGAPVPLDEARGRLKKHFEDLMYQSAVDNGIGCFQAADPNQGPGSFPRQISYADIAHVFGVDEIVDRLMQRLKAQGKKPGLPLADRPKKVRELQLEIRRVERDAEIEALRLEKAGYAVLRRADADPTVLLEVWAEAA